MNLVEGLDIVQRVGDRQVDVVVVRVLTHTTHILTLRLEERPEAELVNDVSIDTGTRQEVQVLHEVNLNPGREQYTILLGQALVTLTATNSYGVVTIDGLEVPSSVFLVDR